MGTNTGTPGIWSLSISANLKFMAISAKDTKSNKLPDLFEIDSDMTELVPLTQISVARRLRRARWIDLGGTLPLSSSLYHLTNLAYYPNDEDQADRLNCTFDKNLYRAPGRKNYKVNSEQKRTA